MVRLAAFFFAHSAMSAAQTARLTAFGNSKKCLFMRLFSFRLLASVARCGVACCGTRIAPQRVTCQARCGVFSALHKKHGDVLLKLHVAVFWEVCYIIFNKISKG